MTCQSTFIFIEMNEEVMVYLRIGPCFGRRMRPQKLDLNNKGDGRVLQAMSIQRIRLPVFQGDPRAGNPGTSYEPDTHFVSVA